MVFFLFLPIFGEVVLCCVKRETYDSNKIRKGLLTWVFWAKIPLGGWKGYVTGEWGNYACAHVIWITVWVVSKNESICLLENKMVSYYYMLFSQTFYGLLFRYLTITDVTPYVHHKFPVSILLYIATKNIKTNDYWSVHYCPVQFYECSYHKKITLARFACLCFHFSVSPIFMRVTHFYKFDPLLQV